MDLSFLPEDYWEDHIVLDRNGEPCYNCESESQFYNVTVGRSECEAHTASRDKEFA